jgi:nitrogen fixation NifU-like protein
MDNFDERILEAVRSTRRVGKLENCTLRLEALNKGCGDRVVLYVLLDSDTKIDDIRYEARGCMLSRASVSIACDAVVGLGIEKAISSAGSLISFGSFSKGEVSVSTECSLACLEDAKGLIESVRHIPLRMECALLPWRAFL